MVYIKYVFTFSFIVFFEVKSTENNKIWRGNRWFFVYGVYTYIKTISTSFNFLFLKIFQINA